MAGPVVDLRLQGGQWQLYRDPPLPPPVGVAVEGNGGDALRACTFVTGTVFASGNEKWPPSKMQIWTQAKLSLKIVVSFRSQELQSVISQTHLVHLRWLIF
jgi:hypothetical protein